MGLTNILLVEDDPNAGPTLALLLGDEGFTVKLAARAEEALAVVDAGLRPDAALIDIGLPGMNGHQLCQRLRANPALSGVWLLAVTARGDDADKRQSIDVGFDMHMVKPVDVDDLVDLLRRLPQHV